MADSLWGVAIGGLIGIVGTTLGPLVQHFLSLKTREEDVRKANISTAILTVHELDNWLDNYRVYTAFGSGDPPGISPRGKLEALVLVSFKDATNQLHALNVAVAGIQLWSIERSQERIAGRPLTGMKEFLPLSQDAKIASSNLIAAIAGGRQYHRSDVYGPLASDEAPTPNPSPKPAMPQSAPLADRPTPAPRAK